MSDLGNFYLLLLISLSIFLMIKKFRKRIHGDEFEYLTVREQLALANETADIISEMEQLETDLQESHADDVMRKMQKTSRKGGKK